MPGKSEANGASVAGLRSLLVEEIRRAGPVRGRPLPSIRQISRRHGVSKAVAEKAVRRLVAEGLCYAQQGRGVFVAVNDPAALDEKLTASRTIAVVFGYLEYPATDHHFYRQVYEGIQEWIVGGRSNVLKLYSWRAKSARQKDEELARFAGGVDGLIALGIYEDADCIRLRNSGLPLAVVDHDAAALGIDCAVMSDAPAVRELARRALEASGGEVFCLCVGLEASGEPCHAARLDIIRRAARAAGRAVAAEGVVTMGGDPAPDDAAKLAGLREAIRAGRGRPVLIADDEHLVARVVGRLREDGAEPMRDYVLAYLGPEEPPPELAGVPALVAGFDFRALGRAGGKLLAERMRRGPGRPVKRTVGGTVRERAR